MHRTKGKPDPLMEMVPTYEELISPEKALKIITENRSEIESVKFLPSRSDSGNLGMFRVKWKKPGYRNPGPEDI